MPTGSDPAQRPYPPGDNHWQHGAILDALYLADSEACAWAEWYRHLAEAAIPPSFALPRDLWRYDVKTLDVADLSGPDRLARIGLGPPRPGRRGWSPYQAVGEQLCREGWRGLIATSAARPTSLVLAVFLSDAGIPNDVIPAGSTLVTESPVPPTGMRT